VYLASITHCRSFEVEYSNPRLLSSFLDVPTIYSRRLALLENFSVTWNQDEEQIALFFPLFCAPNLRSATWIGLDYLRLDASCRNWVNLRELTLGSVQALEPLLTAISRPRTPCDLQKDRMSSIQYPNPYPTPAHLLTCPIRATGSDSLRFLDHACVERTSSPSVELRSMATNTNLSRKIGRNSGGV